MFECFSPRAQIQFNKVHHLRIGHRWASPYSYWHHISSDDTAGSIYKRKIDMLEKTRFKINYPCCPVHTKILLYCF